VWKRVRGKGDGRMFIEKHSILVRILDEH